MNTLDSTNSSTNSTNNFNSTPGAADGRGFPPWEDLGYWIGILATAAGKGLAWKLAPFGISPVQFKILHVCSVSAATTIGSLSREVPVDSAAISRNVAVLCRRGFMQRQRSRGDRRSFRLALTETGRESLLCMLQCVREHNDALLAGISEEEKRSFLATVRKMLASSGERSLPAE